MAPPLKLTESTIKTLEDAVRMGCTLEEAAEAAGMTERTVHRHLAQGRLDREAGQETPDSVLVGAVEIARAAWRQLHLEKVAASKQWASSAWLLERHQKQQEGAAKIAYLKTRTRLAKARADAEASLAERLAKATDEELKMALQELKEARAREPVDLDGE